MIIGTTFLLISRLSIFKKKPFIRSVLRFYNVVMTSRNLWRHVIRANSAQPPPKKICPYAYFGDWSELALHCISWLCAWLQIRAISNQTLTSLLHNRGNISDWPPLKSKIKILIKAYRYQNNFCVLQPSRKCLICSTAMEGERLMLRNSISRSDLWEFVLVKKTSLAFWRAWTKMVRDIVCNSEL